MKSYSDWTFDERYTFLHQLRQPHQGLDRAIADMEKKQRERGNVSTAAAFVDGPAAVTVEQFSALVEEEIQQLLDEIEAHEEALAERHSIQLDGKSTTECATDALRRPERFAGQHAVARAWLREHAPQVRIFTKVAS